MRALLAIVSAPILHFRGRLQETRQARRIETPHSLRTASTNFRFRTGFIAFGGARPATSLYRATDPRRPSTASCSPPRAASIAASLSEAKPSNFRFQLKYVAWADAGFPANIRYRHPIRSLLQNECLLRVRKLRRLHASAPRQPLQGPAENSTSNDPVLGKRITSNAASSLVRPVAIACWKRQRFFTLPSERAY